MLKLVGGTTWHWAAACWRYLPNDMKLNSLYGVGRDWPMEYSELEPYYARAEVALGVCGSDTQDQSGHNGGAFPPRSTPYPMPPEGDTYLFQRLRARLAPAGYVFCMSPMAVRPRLMTVARRAAAITTACRCAPLVRCTAAMFTPNMLCKQVPSC